METIPTTTKARLLQLQATLVDKEQQYKSVTPPSLIVLDFHLPSFRVSSLADDPITSLTHPFPFISNAFSDFP